MNVFNSDRYLLIAGYNEGRRRNPCEGRPASGSGGTCLALLFLLTASTVVHAASQPAAYRFVKEVAGNAVHDEAILGVRLDSDIYASTRENFPDVRVVDSNGQEISYVLEKLTEIQDTTVRRMVTTEVISLHEAQDNQIEVLVQLDKAAPAAGGFTVFTPLKNYEQKVRVLGSSDGRSWVPLVDNALIFDYSRYMDVSNNDVRLPVNSQRQFKVAIDNVTQEQESPHRLLMRKFSGDAEATRIETTVVNQYSFRINRLSFWHEITSKQMKSARETAYPISKFQTEEDTEAKSTIIHVHTRREPLTKFTLLTDSSNFSRRAVVETPVIQGVRTKWNEVGRATIAAIDFHDFEREELTIKFPEQRHEKYRITIANEDNQPLTVTGVTAAGNIYRTKFLVSSDEKYRVLYGSETATSPKYDTATVLTSMQEEYRTIDVALGEETGNPVFDRTADFTFGKLLENKLVLGGVILVMVVILGWILFGAGQQVGDISDE